MPPPIQNYAGSDLEGTILRKILQNQVLLAIGNSGSPLGIGGIYPQPFADFRQFLKTYSASGSGAAAASCTDFATLAGAAAAQVFVTKVVVSGFETAAAAIRIALIKRALVDTAGTSGALTAIPHYSTDAAAAAAALLYSVNPTINNTVGNIDVRYIPLMAAATINTNGVEFNFGATGKPILLNGAVEQLAVNFNGVTLAGNALAVRFEWYEV